MSEIHVHTKETLALAVKVAGIGIGFVNYVDDTITLDDRAAEMFDLPVDAAVSRQRLHDRIHRDDWSKIALQVDQLLDPKQENIINVAHRVVHSDGSLRWLNARKLINFAPEVEGQKPRPLSGLVAIIDVTEHKRSEQKIQFLMEELSHRSKNLLTVVQSVARRTFSNGDPDTFLDRYSARLTGLAQNLDVLVRGDWSHADLGQLVRAHLQGFGDADSPRLRIEGPRIKLNHHAAQGIGMALHELATNATKYGALSGASGQVAISWTLQQTPDVGLTLTWQESGGPTVVTPERTGFGQRVLREMAAASVNGQVDLRYDPEGLYWRLKVPHAALK